MGLIVQRYTCRKKVSCFGAGEVCKGREGAGQLHQRREAEVAN